MGTHSTDESCSQSSTVDVEPAIEFPITVREDRGRVKIGNLYAQRALQLLPKKHEPYFRRNPRPVRTSRVLSVRSRQRGLLYSGKVSYDRYFNSK